MCGSESPSKNTDWTSNRRLSLPLYSPRPNSSHCNSSPAFVFPFFTAFSCPSLGLLHSSQVSSVRKVPNIMIHSPVVSSLKRRKRLDSFSNPQLSQTFHTKDSETDSLFSEMRYQRGSYFENHRYSSPPCFPLQSHTDTSLAPNTTSCSNPLSSDDLDKKDCKTPMDSVECWEEKPCSPVQEFVSVDKYESPYLEESVCRISSFCLENEDGANSPDASDEKDYISHGNLRLARKGPLLGYTDCIDDSTTLPPIYELEGEGSDITELPRSRRSSQICGPEWLNGVTERTRSHSPHPLSSDSCAQYCSNNDSIMSYYSVVPPEEGRESVRNVDHLVDRLDVKCAQGCSSPASPFPLTPPNTCDSSPKLSNIVVPARNNLHALSGVEVKYCPLLGCCCS